MVETEDDGRFDEMRDEQTIDEFVAREDAKNEKHYNDALKGII